MDMTSIGNNHIDMDKSTQEQLLSRVTLLEKEQRTMRRQLVNLIVKYNQMNYEKTMDYGDRFRHRNADPTHQL